MCCVALVLILLLPDIYCQLADGYPNCDHHDLHTLVVTRSSEKLIPPSSKKFWKPEFDQWTEQQREEYDDYSSASKAIMVDLHNTLSIARHPAELVQLPEDMNVGAVCLPFFWFPPLLSEEAPQLISSSPRASCLCAVTEEYFTRTL